MSTTLSDRELLLRAIALDPDDDTVRLAYADWLQEHATTDSDRGRDEVIRVQCELARRTPFPETHDYKCAFFADARCRRCQCGTLMLRADELIRLHATEWRRPPCRNMLCVEGEIRAGHPNSWRDCKVCGGTVLHRGMWVVDVPFGDMGTDDWSGAKTGWDFYTPWLAWAVSAAREAMSFKITDAGQFIDEGTDTEIGYGYWWRDAAVYDHETLPPQLTPPVTENIFDSVEDAYEWLSRRVTALVCKEAWPEQP